MLKTSNITTFPKGQGDFLKAVQNPKDIQIIFTDNGKQPISNTAAVF